MAGCLQKHSETAEQLRTSRCMSLPIDPSFRLEIALTKPMPKWPELTIPITSKRPMVPYTFLSTSRRKEMDRFFAYAKPEEVGIRSEHVQDFIVKLDAYDLCMHSVLLIRRRKLVAEAYYAPFTAKTLHRMFSVTKSFTSLAIGLLQEEGKLSLDHQIADYFPEKLPNQGLHPYLRETTIRDMLIMASPHATTTYQRRPVEDWVQSFFAVEPTHPP